MLGLGHDGSGLGAGPCGGPLGGGGLVVIAAEEIVGAQLLVVLVLVLEIEVEVQIGLFTDGFVLERVQVDLHLGRIELVVVCHVSLSVFVVRHAPNSFSVSQPRPVSSRLTSTMMKATKTNTATK